jgi:hypothetical protein
LVVTAVSSINTRRAESSQPCSRIQRRRARATSARFRSAARKLFLTVMPWRAKKRDSALRLPRIRRLCSTATISSNVRSGCSRLRARSAAIFLQRGSAPSTWHRFASPIFAKALHPADRRTGADLELFSRFTSRSSRCHELNYANSQVPRIWSPHWPALRRINALDSLRRRALEIPIHSGRDTL